MQFAIVSVCILHFLFIFATDLSIQYMETKTITIRIPQKMYEEMQAKTNDSSFGSINQQIVDSLQKNEVLLKMSTNELRGIFSVGEWSALADMLNSTMVTPEFRYRPEFLIAEIEDTMSLEQDLEKKWNIDITALKEKCSKLTASQLDALYTRVEEFWAHPNTDLEKWSNF